MHGRTWQVGRVYELKCWFRYHAYLGWSQISKRMSLLSHDGLGRIGCRHVRQKSMHEQAWQLIDSLNPPNLASQKHYSIPAIPMYQTKPANVVHL
jgi:hypothetical protein